MNLTFLLALAVNINASMLRFIASPKTPFDLDSLAFSVTSHLSSHVQYTVTNLSGIRNEEADLEEGVVFDYTYDQELSASLRLRNPDVLVMWSEGLDSVATKEYGDMFTRYMRALHFTRVTLISDSKQTNLQLSQYLVHTHPSVYEELQIIPYNADEGFCLQFVGEVLKPSGANLFAIVTDEVVALNLLRAFETKKLGSEGYAYVLSNRARYYQHLASNFTGLLSTGTLYVASAFTALARSLEEGEEILLTPILERLESGLSISDVAKARFNQSFVLVNIVNSVPKIVVNFPEEIGLNMSFPGNTSIIPTRTMVMIRTSVDYEFLDSTGYILPQSRIVMRGVQVAFEETNNSTKIIPNFQVNDSSLSLSGLTFNYTFTRLQVRENLAKLGVIYIPPPLGGNINSTYQIFQELNITQPVTGISGYSALSSPVNYPMYVTARADGSTAALTMARLFSYFGWTKAAILYSQDQGDNQDLYQSFMSLTSTFGINITNAEAMRGVSPAPEVTAQLNASITDIMRSSVRIIIISHNYLMTVFTAMYDLGVRSDYLICTWYGLGQIIVSDAIPDNLKSKIIAKGAIQIYPTAFIGEQGQAVLTYLKAWDGMNYLTIGCSYYDSTMLYLHSTDYMIQRGIDYEDPFEIIKAMRGTRFTGCSGIIKIAPDSNTPGPTQFSVLNVKYYESNDTVVVEDVMYYNPYSFTLYQQLKPIMWPDNSKIFNDTLIYPCPFLEKQRRNFATGLVVGITVLVSICFLTGFTAFLSWKYIWNIQYPLLQSKHELSADDFLQLLGVPLEFLMIAAAGPSAQSVNADLAQLFAIATIDVAELYHTNDGRYWIMLDYILGFLGIYVVLCSLKWSKLEKKLECLPLFSFVMLWVDLALPVLSHLLFFPVISALSSVFACYQTIDDSFTSSFLNYDCSQFCWQGTHLIYAVLCFIALVVYIPLGVVTKPKWQELQPILHIKVQLRL